MRTIGIIPARAGSKSIPHKNTVLLGHKLLIEWCMDEVLKCRNIDFLVCSTDDKTVKELCRNKGINHIRRKRKLAGDNVPILEVILDVLKDIGKYDVVALIQPTSPFIDAEVIDDCLGRLDKNYIQYNSIQTITSLPHNHHAWNQRIWDHNGVWFAHKERFKAHNKQLKPNYYIFGNFAATRVDALNFGVFAMPSLGVYINQFDAIDIDGPEDLLIAEYYAKIRAGKENTAA